MTERKFSEMLHGDILWRKQQATAQWMRRKGKTEMVVLDAEAGVSYMTASHYDVHSTLVRALRGGRGFGKAFEGKGKIFAAAEVKRKIDAANPACAAELAHGGEHGRYSFSFKTLGMREWQKLNFAYYYGMGELWKV